MTKRVPLAGKGVAAFNPTSDEQTSTLPEKNTSIEVRQRTSKKEKEELVKTGFYFTPSEVKSLEKFYLKVRQSGKGKNVTKSRIVSRGLLKLIDDLNDKPVEVIIDVIGNEGEVRMRESVDK